MGTAVNLDANVFVPGQAASIYLTGVGQFGSYVDMPIAGIQVNDNFQAVDATAIVLRPSLLDLDQDNVTDLKLSEFNKTTDMYYGTFTGPSFDKILGDGARSFLFDPGNPLF